MPGDPIDIMIAGNPEATAEDAARLRALHGLDQPIITRYSNWLSTSLSGDFGYSRLFSKPVLDVMWPRLWSTLALMGGSIFLSVLLALPLGVHAARKPYSWSDKLINLGCFAGISIPAFWLALLMITLFAVILGWLPAGGLGDEEMTFFRSMSYYIMPILTLTLASVGGYTRHIRSSMIEALKADHIRTARAKGCSERHVIWKHALNNALIPVVTLIALDFGTLFGGALITETMFAIPGMGKLIYDSIMGNDYNLALISLLFVTLMILIGNFLADLTYVSLDPRIKLKEGSS